MTRFGLGRNGAWSALAAGVATLGVLETAVLHFLARAYLPAAAAVTVDTVAVAVTLLAILAFASPLWGSFRLDSTALRLRFGWLASVRIPLPDIDTIRPATAGLRRPVTLGLDYDQRSGLLSVVRSPSSPLVRIELTTPIRARTQGWKHVRVRTVLATIDDPDLLRQCVSGA